MGFVLYIVSVLMEITFVPIGVLFGLIKAFYHTDFKNGLKHADAKFRKMAVGTDVFGNVYMEELLNFMLIKKDASHKFGEYGITISAVLGHNEIMDTLKPLGRVIVAILNKIEPNHCLKAYSDFFSQMNQ